MTPTLDTAAIRRRFEQAIIGIRVDGTMAVLVETIASNWFDIVDGGTYNELMVRDLFTTLIRPGDRCEVMVGEGRWMSAVYRGVATAYGAMFVASIDNRCPRHFTHIRPLPAAEPKPEPETGQHFNALEYWLTHGLKREQEWDKIRQIFRNALGDNPGCPFCLSYISEPEPNPLLTRLTAAEQELAAIRAEMEQVQK